MSMVDGKLAALLAAVLLHAPAAAQDCSVEPLGQLPIDDLHGGDYLGLEGGLYPGRSNLVPADHLQAGRSLSKRIVPLGPDGEPADDGAIVMVSIGHSLTAQVFEWFQLRAASDLEMAPGLRFVTLSGPFEDLEKMRDPQSRYWTEIVPDRLAEEGITPEQVQVAWSLQGTAFAMEPFPEHVEATAQRWIDVLKLLKQTFPNLKLAFLSPLYWHGYSDGAPEREPYYFEQGFSVREVVARQLAGDPELNWDPELGPALAPWIDWGPYFWSDGEEPRTDGLAIACADIAPDGTHLAQSGREKLGDRLHHFLKSHRACTKWSIVPGSSPSERMADVERIGDGTAGAQGEPRVCGGSLPTIPHPDPYRLLVRQGLPRARGLMVIGDSLFPGGGVPFGGGTLYVEPDSTTFLRLDFDGNGVLEVDSIPDDPALVGLSYFAQFVISDPAGPDGRHALTSAIELRLGD